MSEYVEGVRDALAALDEAAVSAWGEVLAGRLLAGGRLLVAGNGGSAAQAQHLVAELVGRFGGERIPLPAVALSADSAVVTAVGNDYGFAEVFARQVRAHAGHGDVLLVLSTSGRSMNILRAVQTARELGVTTWALTGAEPNPVAAECDECVSIDSPTVSTVQECHLVAAHLLCVAVEEALASERPSSGKRAAVRSMGMVVIGDVLLDRDVVGEATRLSPEAPVPVVQVREHRERVGGAGLAAVLAARDGHTVTLVTALSDDPNGVRARQLLDAAEVRVVDLGTADTIGVKTRVRVQDRTLMRLDEGAQTSPPLGHRAAEMTALIAAAECLLVADYGRGVAGDPAVRAAVGALVGRRVPIVWDPHPRGAVPIAGISMVVPNRAEAAAALGESADEHGLAVDVSRARRLRERWGVGYVVVTRGTLGAVMVADATSPPLAVPCAAAPAEDSCGAGDRFAVTLTAELGARSGPSTAMACAVAAATRFVTSGDRSHRSHAGGDARAVAARVRAAGGTVVAAGGCFDLLHAGHVQMLEQARELGDCLVVCLNGDASVTRLKGEGRPVVPTVERAAMLTALSCVDAVLVFDEDTPIAALRQLRPDIFVKGGDYAGVELPENDAVREWGGQVVLVSYRDGLSTTRLIERAAGGRDE